MAIAKRDANNVPTMLAASNADGTTPVLVKANPLMHALQVDDGSSGSDLGGSVAARDGNGVTVAMAVSSADGTTPVALYADPVTGKLLIKST